MTAMSRAHLLVLGGDIGGTATRIIVADDEGNVHARGTAGGGNPVSHPETAADAFGEALARALAGIDPRQIGAAVVGLAGGSALRDPVIGRRFDAAWSRAGLAGRPDYRSDLEVAYAAGTDEPDGVVLIAGTGAVAGTITGQRLDRTVDGHGWLLGDDGSGYWVGRAAVRATLRELEEPGHEPGFLTASVVHRLVGQVEVDGSRDLRVRIVHAVNDRAPVLLAELAPLVSEAHLAGDPVATSIVDGAAQRLAVTLDRLGAHEGPVVLAGSLTRPDSPVGNSLRNRIGRPAAIRTARDEVAGAAWLALAAGDVGLAADPQVRNRLLEGADRTGQR